METAAPLSSTACSMDSMPTGSSPFCAAYPTATDCAEVSLADILRLWQGLGSPRRAVHLHAASRAIRDQHGGYVPDALDALLALPGVGPYTARAVLAFAFERDVAVVDTNIARVLARATGSRLTPRQAQWAADDLVPLHHGWAWNQIIMDLGALICRPTPRCDECPVADTCAWNRAGRPDPDPATGSAGVSRAQAPFEGSDRQKRGEVLAALLGGAQPASGFPERIVDGLVNDGLVERLGDRIRLPE